MFPVCEFDHLDEHFNPTTEVAADHPLIALRPDLFTPDKPTTRRKPTTKE